MPRLGPGVSLSPQQTIQVGPQKLSNELFQSLTRPARPAFGVEGGIAALGQPMANALLANVEQSREDERNAAAEEKKQQAQQMQASALGRMLQAAAKAKAAGQSPGGALAQAAQGLPPGAAPAVSGALSSALTQTLKPQAQPKPPVPGRDIPYSAAVLAQRERLKRAGKPETNINLGLSKGQEALDKAAAKDVNTFALQGGFADAEKGINQLRTVRNKLVDPVTGEAADNLTGPLIGMLPDAVQAAVNPEALDTRELVEEVVQRNLRLILGAQFTEKEGVRLIERAYNPKLDEKTNAKRLNRLLGSMESAYAAKVAAAKYFQENGTMKGYGGPTKFSADQILKNSGLGGGKDTPGAAQPSPAAIEALQANPSLARQFNAKYGRGAAAKILKK